MSIVKFRSRLQRLRESIYGVCAAYVLNGSEWRGFRLDAIVYFEADEHRARFHIVQSNP